MTGKPILHYGNIAGASFFNSLALRNIGISSYHVIPSTYDPGATDRNQSNRALPFDQVLYPPHSHPLRKLSKQIWFSVSTAHNISLIHYYGTTVIKNGLDSQLFKQAGIPMIITWAGGEARIIREAWNNNPYFFLPNDEARDRQTRKRLERFATHIRYVATDPEMAVYSLPYFEKVFILPQPIDLGQFRYSPEWSGRSKPVVMHIPTHREVKGTAFIEAAVERLHAEGLEFEFLLLEPIYTQQQVREFISQCDIYVDELRCGSYGITAVEGMASGKPTVTYIRDDLLEHYPAGLPLVNANPNTIYDRLKQLILDSNYRKEVGLKSRKYIEEHHALEVIGPKLVEIYQEIGWRHP